MLLKEDKAPVPADLQELGLTGREAEMLFWLAKGKTYQEIGMLCGISHQTVQKHLENIFPKIGVETRTAAAGVALESLANIRWDGGVVFRRVAVSGRNRSGAGDQESFLRSPRSVTGQMTVRRPRTCMCSACWPN